MTTTKILLIRFSSIGDIVLTTPVIRCLAKQLPAITIHYLTKKSFQPVLCHNPYIDQLHFLQDSIKETIKQLKKENFNYVIDLHNNQRSLLIKLALGVKSFSFNKLNVEKWLFTQLKYNRLPKVHIVDRYLATTQSFGLVNDKEGLDYFISPTEQVDITSTFPFLSTQQYIAFVIGAAHATKRLPNHQIIKICQQITYPVLLLGGPSDAENGQIIAQESGSHVHSTCGQFSLNQSASLVAQAYKVITHDTGLMHIAAAFRKPIISIWGNTVPEFGMYPYVPKGYQYQVHIIENKQLQCRPCSKIGYKTCPKKHFNCMEKIDLNTIIQLIHN